MITNTVAGLNKVIDMLWEIEDTARAVCGQEGYDAIQDVIKSAQIAWNVCKKGMEARGYKPLGNSRKAIKSGNNPSGPIVKITEKDIQDAIDTIMANASATWYKKLYSFGDGTSLYFCAGVGEGFDENDENVICGKVACMPDNSGMTEYNYDFIMPYYKDTSDVYDTESLIDGPGDCKWFNRAAENIVRGVKEGELVTSACHGKSKKKNKKKAVTSKSIKSGMSYEQALADFTSMGKPWGDYWSMQEDWAFYVDSLTRDGVVDYEEARWWDNPCTPETFREWINSSKSIKSSDDIMDGLDSDTSDDEEPVESCVKRNRDSINALYKD